MAKIKRFVWVCFKLAGIFLLVSFPALVLMTIGEFISIDLEVTESNFVYIALYYLLPFLFFVVSVIFLMKSKAIKPFLFYILLIVTLYGSGKIYANQKIKPFQQAAQYVKEAETNSSWKTNKDSVQYLKGEEESVLLYQKASLQNFGYEVWIKKYYGDWYNFKKEMYEIDKKLINGQLVMSAEELNNKVKEFDNRGKELQTMVVGPFWMGLYRVSY